MNPIITATNLKKIYRTKDVKVKALAGVDISIDEGEFCAIVGTSGSGKSTLLSLLAGLEPPTKGKIVINGYEISAMNEKQLTDFRLRNIGFIFQSFNLMNTMTAKENVALPLTFMGVPVAKRLRAAEKMLKEMELGDRMEHKPSELSGGQQQRVAIARALVARPKIIFADEPTGNLDSKTSEQIMNIIYNISKSHGATVVYVTHDLDKAKYADKIIHIIDGKVAKIEGGKQ